MWIQKVLFECLTEGLVTHGLQYVTQENTAKENLITTGWLVSMKIPSNSGRLLESAWLFLKSTVKFFILYTLKVFTIFFCPSP